MSKDRRVSCTHAVGLVVGSPMWCEELGRGGEGRGLKESSYSMDDKGDRDRMEGSEWEESEGDCAYIYLVPLALRGARARAKWQDRRRSWRFSDPKTNRTQLLIQRICFEP